MFVFSRAFHQRQESRLARLQLELLRLSTMLELVRVTGRFLHDHRLLCEKWKQLEIILTPAVKFEKKLINETVLKLQDACGAHTWKKFVHLEEMY